MVLKEFIDLTPPLIWRSAGAEGELRQLSTDTLVLKGLPQGKEEELVSLDVYLGGKTWPFRGRVQGVRDGLAYLQLEDANTHDLLGQLRKAQHIELCNTHPVEDSQRYTGFGEVHFIPNPLGGLNEAELDLRVEFLGRTFAAPLWITGMTGGIEAGQMINQRLAKAAQALQIPMGIGSQRIALDNPEYAPIFSVKKYAPDIFLIGNLGLAQLLSQKAYDRCQKAVDMIEADALAIHLNVVQELVQVEGDRNFRGLLKTLDSLCQKLPVPVIVKEVGCGLTPESALQLKNAGVAALDIGGRGGTSWGYIEGLRSPSSATRELGEIFRDWGIPTAYSLAAVKRSCPTLPLIATGGIRDGLMVAKAVALGATFAGIGLPLLRAALVNEDQPTQVLLHMQRALKATMLATGQKTLDQLKQALCYGVPYQDALRAEVSRNCDKFTIRP